MTGISPAVVHLSGGNLVLVIIVFLIALGALAMAYMFRQEVLAAGEGTDNMKNIAHAVQEGANAYLARQFRTLAVFAVLAFLLLLALPADDLTVRVFRSVFFLVGAGFSATVGYLGMNLAVRANLRVAAAANEQGRDPAMRIGFRTGATVGMLTVGLGLLGASIVVIAFGSDAPAVLEGFGFGAALLAMFMRVGGGIFTKAADVGADLVGKVEQHIPEDDPRNAATIADNVGDNVGDCAGMAADLFESYAVVLVAALILGQQAFGPKGLVFPLLIPAIGALTAVLGIYLCKPRAGENGLTTINRAFYISAAVSAVACVVLSFVYLPTSFDKFTVVRVTTLDRVVGVTHTSGNPALIASVAVVIGIVLAAAILALTGYFTGTEYKPVQGRRPDLAHRRGHGHPVRPLGRLRVGRLHRRRDRRCRLRCRAPRWCLADRLAVLCGPGRGRSADHGRRDRRDGHLRPGLRQRPGHRRDVGRREPRRRPDPHRARRGRQHHQGDHQGHRDRHRRAGGHGAVRVLRHVGDRQARGVRRRRGTRTSSCSTSSCSTPGCWSASCSARRWCSSSPASRSTPWLGLRAPWSTRYAVSSERSPGIMEGTGRPEYGKVVDIVTKDSLRELVTPGVLAVLAPIAVGFGLGVASLAGFLAGAIGTGTLMAVFLANSGGAWDNAKKLVEDGNHGGKGSDAHDATIIGDTVGDPFKDTAGPAINPLIKVMNLVSLLIASAIVSLSVGNDKNDFLRYTIAIVALLIIVASVYISKQREVVLGDELR